MSVTPAGEKSAVFFETPADLRRWFQRHHKTAIELWVGYRKKKTGLASITWQESVDEALCFGWIDGIRKSIDGDSYANRFTPRRLRSVWSAVNTRRAVELVRQGRMRAAGRKAFEARDTAKTASIFSVRDNPRLDQTRDAAFRANRTAWKFFLAQPPGYRRLAIWWIVSAKREATRTKRFDQLLAVSAARRRIPIGP